MNAFFGSVPFPRDTAWFTRFQIQALAASSKARWLASRHLGNQLLRSLPWDWCYRPCRWLFLRCRRFHYWDQPVFVFRFYSWASVPMVCLEGQAKLRDVFPAWWMMMAGFNNFKALEKNNRKFGFPLFETRLGLQSIEFRISKIRPWFSRRGFVTRGWLCDWGLSNMAPTYFMHSAQCSSSTLCGNWNSHSDFLYHFVTETGWLQLAKGWLQLGRPASEIKLGLHNSSADAPLSLSSPSLLSQRNQRQTKVWCWNDLKWAESV